MATENNTPEITENDASDTKRCKNKASHKIMIAAGLAAVVGVAAYAGAAQSSGWGNDDHGFGHGSSHGKRGHMMAMFNEFDTNSDGRLTKTEIDAARTSRFSEVDGNNDAALSLEEFQDLWMNFMRPQMVDKFQMLDENGDGRVTEQEFAKPFNMALRYMDRDDDGVLEMKEMKHKRHWYYDDDDDDDDRDKD